MGTQVIQNPLLARTTDTSLSLKDTSEIQAGSPLRYTDERIQSCLRKTLNDQKSDHRRAQRTACRPCRPLLGASNHACAPDTAVRTQHSARVQRSRTDKPRAGQRPSARPSAPSPDRQGEPEPALIDRADARRHTDRTRTAPSRRYARPEAGSPPRAGTARPG